MLNFYRRIRRKLIDEGKLKRYLIYAIGEILLVMIGILLALQVNNWNENNKSNKQKSQLVQDLLGELNNTNSKLNSSISLAELTVKKGDLFFYHTENKRNWVSVDSMGNLLNLILSGTPYELELPSYEEAKSTGR